MIKSEKEALAFFAQTLIANLGNVTFSSCKLEIERQLGMSGFSPTLIDLQGEETSFRINEKHELHEVIRELYTITQTQPPIHKDWNKAVFTLYPDGKVDMEYIWDAEWQAELDKLRADFERKRNRRKK